MKIYPLVERTQITKRGNDKWKILSKEDSPILFNLLEKTVGIEKIYEMTSDGYIPF